MFIFFLILNGCANNHNDSDPNADSQGNTSPTKITARTNARVAQELLFQDNQDFEDAQKGFIASNPNLKIKNSRGEFVWNQEDYNFIKGDAPASVNPSLWRQARLNNIHGLFKVTDGIYQIRGYDLANMTIIEGKTGWIIVDPLTAKETAATAMALARKHLNDKPIMAILFTHSHLDHFGGALGIITPEQAKKQNVRIIAPQGFMEEATSENIIAGVAMGRRAGFMYGMNLAHSERGHIDAGLGKAVANGTYGILKPTELIDQTSQEKIIDGVRFVFQFTPESEAPAEFTFYLPEKKTFCGAEIVSNNMHNLYTLRGAKVRNALKWSQYIDEAIELFGQAKIYIGCHHWPKWGNQRIINFLKIQRDTYKYIHDQTVRLFNKGYTPSEIAEEVKLPKSLQTAFNNRGYYGTIRHNTRAVYQGYLGWYDSNPANLNPLAPKQTGIRYVKLMGGADTVLKKAAILFDKGEYRFVAQLLNHLVFAQPDNTPAKNLLANTYDQLGYQSESGPWRDVYLSGAYELRHGAPEKGIDPKVLKKVLEQTPIPYFFDSMAVRLNAKKAEGKNITMKITFTDLNESYELILENSVLHHRKTKLNSQSTAGIRVTHDFFMDIVTGEVKIKDLIFSDKIKFDGNFIDLSRFLSLFEKPGGTFNIVTP
ncbi:MAG: MBL fold metallo-hydrolase [Desulfobacteraceae bacterium]|nr:MBL fold metallo-hydrolase [Desulfobacteraceae bacterium]